MYQLLWIAGIRIIIWAAQQLASAAAAGWRLGELLWRQRTAATDPLQWLFRLRNVLGLVVLATAYLVWRPDAIDGWQAINHGINDRFAAALPLVAAVFLAAAVLVSCARRGRRRHMFTSAMIPVATVVITALGITVATLAMWGLSTATTSLATSPPADDGYRILIFLIMFVVALAMPFLTTAALTLIAGFAYHAVGSAFRAHDAHPLMPALVSIAVAAWTIWVNVAQFAAGATGVFPLPVQLALTLGGPIIVIGLSVWQLLRLGKVHSLRDPWWRTDDSRLSRLALRATDLRRRVPRTY
ncbi:hypothetical protein [Microbacterium sp.]|uniref:hypothetical protein n=1 Tax=Microbacterium sp. TaxID=51671 RepID=UPI003A89947E